jgi:hypothetical protein
MSKSKIAKGTIYLAIALATVTTASVVTAGATATPSQRVVTSVAFGKETCTSTYVCHEPASLSLAPGDYLLSEFGKLVPAKCTASAPSVKALIPGFGLDALWAYADSSSAQGILVSVGPRGGSLAIACGFKYQRQPPTPVSLVLAATPAAT